MRSTNPNVVEAVPVAEAKEVQYVLWRVRRQGGFFREAVGDFNHVKAELAAEVKWGMDDENDGARPPITEADVLARYRVVRETTTTTRHEVPTAMFR